MRFSSQSGTPRRTLAGLSFVLFVHVAVVYALVTGLAKKVVDVVRAPIETRVIEEVKPPPAPAEVLLPPPPPHAPPPPFVPPPEVLIQTPAPQETITATTPTPPPTHVDIAPAPPAPAAAPAPPAPQLMPASVVCSNYASVMGDSLFPREAIKLGLENGSATIQFTLAADGEVRDVRALRSSHPVFARNSLRIVGEYKCQGQGRDVLVQVPFNYRLQ